MAGIPEVFSDFTRFRLDPSTDASLPRLPSSLQVSWYRNRPPVAIGERWRLEMQLKPPWGRLNFLGPDRERWLFYQGIGGLGSIRSGHLVSPRSTLEFPLQNLRSLIKEKIALLVKDERARGLVQALSIADRTGLLFSDRQLLMSTGTSHLLAISGLHIGLAAAGGTLLVRLLLLLLPFRPFTLFGLRTALSGGLLMALVYAALAGWGVSTQRAVLMIAVAMGAMLLSRAVSPARAYLLALATVLLIDPLAPLSAGFWFSFLAVAVLLLIFVPRPGKLKWWRTIIMAQAGIMLLMLPASAYWFQFFSPVGFFANMLAIPWVSIAVVPLTLVGVLMLLVSHGVAAVLLTLAGKSSLALLAVLEVLAQQQASVSHLPAPGMLALLLASAGGMLLLLPAGLPLRWLGPFFMLPLVLPTSQRLHKQSLLVEILDVGQGTAVLVSTAQHTLIYDSGPGDGHDQNLVNSVITPALAAPGHSVPDRIIISHGDLDHAGGLKTLLTTYPEAQLNGNLSEGQADFAPCHAGLSWTTGEFEVEVLHPSSGLPYLGNNSSCVLSVKGASSSLLLAGDISSSVESRLIATSLSPHRMLLVPHHGSSTSSSAEFIGAVQAEIAIATTGLGNRFGFPRKDVSDRYRAAGVRSWSTGDCGALRVLFTEDGLFQEESARRRRQQIWRWPAAEDCP